MARKIMFTPNAAKPPPTYSQAVKAAGLVFVSGTAPIDPATGNLVTGDITAQADRALRNVSALLRAAGLGFEHVVRTTVFLADMNDFAAMNDVYSRYIVDPAPARARATEARFSPVSSSIRPRSSRKQLPSSCVMPRTRAATHSGERPSRGD